MLENGLDKKTVNTMCLYILPGVVAESPFYNFIKSDIVGSLPDREVACSVSDLQSLNF